MKKKVLNPYKYFRVLNNYFCYNGEDIMVIKFKRLKKGVYSQRHGILSWKFLWQWKLDFKKRYRKQKSERTFETIMVTAVDLMKHRKVDAFIAWVMNADIYKKTKAYYNFTPHYFKEHGHDFKYHKSYEYKYMHTLVRVGSEERAFERLTDVYGNTIEAQLKKNEDKKKVLDRIQEGTRFRRVI